MCNAFCILFGAINLSKQEVEGKAVIEVGSCNVNGSLRPLVESWKPSTYVGIDIAKGPGVDEICSVYDMIDRFGRERFDVVISTEMLEHVENWRVAVSNIKNICRKNGIMLVTTRSKKAEYHNWPYDFWRYEKQDLERIFSDCIIEKLEYDMFSPGIFLKARKPVDFKENDLSDIALYSIITKGRVNDIDKKVAQSFHKKYLMYTRSKEIFSGFMSKVAEFIKSLSGIR